MLERLVDPSKVREVLKWRKLFIREVRPPEALHGNLLSGFFCKQLRAEYIARGKAAAKSALADWPASSP